MAWESGLAWPVAIGAGGTVLFAGMLLAAGLLESRRRRAVAVEEDRRRDRAVLSLSDALGREQSPWAVLREAVGAAAVVTGSESAWSWLGGGSSGVRSLRPGPAYPAWSGRAEDRITAISLAQDAIDSGVPVPASEDRDRRDRWLALPVVTGRGGPAALVLNRRGAQDWSEAEMSSLSRLARLTARALDRALADSSLVAERDRLASLHRDTPDMDLLLDPQGRILRASRRVTEVLGYAGEELEGASLAKLIAPGRGLEVDELLLETLLHGRVHRDALPLRRVDGQTIDSQMEAILSRAPGGGTDGFRLTLREDSGIGRLMDEQGAEIERLEAQLEAAREETVWVDAEWQAREEELHQDIRATLLEREAVEARIGLAGARAQLDHEREVAALREQVEARRAEPPSPLASPPPPLMDSQALVDRASGRILEAAPELARLLGVPAADLVGRRLSELHGIDRSPGLRRRYEELLSGGGGSIPELPPASGSAGSGRAAWSIDAGPWTQGGIAEGTLLVTWTPARPSVVGPGPGARSLLGLLQDCVRAARFEAGRSGVAVHLSAADDPLLGHEAPEELAEAVSDLIGNALRLTPAGGEILVEAGTQELAENDRRVRIVVRDNGIGIPTEDLQRLFELGPPAASPARSASGAELGVNVTRCRAIVQRLGGRLSAESRVGAGTEFRLTLPREVHDGEARRREARRGEARRDEAQ